MNPVETILQYLGSKEFAESIFTGVAGNTAYDAIKPTLENIKRRWSHTLPSEAAVAETLEELFIQIGAL